MGGEKPMENKQEAEEYFKENYGKEKLRSGVNLSVPKLLWIDYQKFCLNLSKKTKKKIMPSARIRLLMIRDMLENKNSFS